MRVIPLLVILAMLPLAAAGFPAQPGDRTVTVTEVKYVDEKDKGAQTYVKAGATVTWVWRLGVHSVTYGVAGTDRVPGGVIFDSGNRATSFDPVTGEPTTKFSHTFNVPGVYPYYCIMHPLMRGQVVVEP